jgi:hypothetical protein
VNRAAHLTASGNCTVACRLFYDARGVADEATCFIGKFLLVRVARVTAYTTQPHKWRRAYGAARTHGSGAKHDETVSLPEEMTCLATHLAGVRPSGVYNGAGPASLGNVGLRPLVHCAGITCKQAQGGQASAEARCNVTDSRTRRRQRNRQQQEEAEQPSCPHFSPWNVPYL